MSLPSAKDVHVDTAMSNIAQGFFQNPAGFGAGEVFAEVPVKKKSDRYYKFNKGDLNRDEARERAPGTNSARGGYRVTDEGYNCKENSFEHPVPDEVYENTDLVQLEAANIQFVTNKLKIRREVKFVESFLATGAGWDTEAAPAGGQWDAGNDPIGDLRGQIEAIKQEVGHRANVIAMGSQVWTVLEDHADLIARMKLSDDKVVTPDLLARLLRVEKIVVFDAVYNAADEGIADDMNFIAPKNVLVCYRTATPSILTPSAGYIFSWKDRDGFPVRMDSYYEERPEQTVYRGKTNYDMKIVTPSAGRLITGAVS